jgi:hypothetical protein
MQVCPLKVLIGISKNLLHIRVIPKGVSKYFSRSFIRECITCSSSDSDAARLREFARPLDLFKETLLMVGLSGGERSELGVLLATAVERSSESSHCLSNMGSLIWLSGDSDMLTKIIPPLLNKLLNFTRCALILEVLEEAHVAK